MSGDEPRARRRNPTKSGHINCCRSNWRAAFGNDANGIFQNFHFFAKTCLLASACVKCGVSKQGRLVWIGCRDEQSCVARSPQGATRPGKSWRRPDCEPFALMIGDRHRSAAFGCMLVQPTQARQMGANEVCMATAVDCYISLTGSLP